jgi:hypothetical protein
MPEPRNPRVTDLERAAALHWQAPDSQPLGDWMLRAAGGFTGRANSALPLGDPGLPLPEAVAAVEDWYRRRDLRPMIVLPQGAGPDPLPAYLAERSWVPRPGPAFVMTAEIADLPASTADVRFSPEPDAAFLGLYRYRGQDLPPIARTLMMSAPWQAFGTICRDGRTVACGRISVAGDLGGADRGGSRPVQPAPGPGRGHHLGPGRRGGRPGRAPDPAPGRDGQRPGPRALPAVRLPRLAPIPLCDCAVSETRPCDAWGDCGFSLRL